MTTARVFVTNRSQAVRIPKAAEFPADVRDVAIRCVGRSRVMSPAAGTWDDFFDADGVDLGMRPAVPARRRTKP
ncbi:antitoxin VapB [Sphingomonas vulcanisoli]|uniref:Antitoxin VapB n=1 Tax=Sphingomonas vulcanisoli TaxID=1658060 RepID=A0ABX0TUY7_9SPHN|nr:type II toxin-antitoxin system VapB family antitoxin [Sphingomonas vulcanisoli]NIJ09332.1 antitoxin VapB [Sphingomonas vulcanisoli]